MKTCKKCGKDKQLEEFYRASKNKDGRKGACKECVEVQSVAWRAANSERVAATTATWVAANQGALKVKWRRKNLKQYGLSIEQYDEMLFNQSERCAICRADVPGGTGANFHVDHDHETGVVRGLLCTDCNLGIGKLGDNIEGVTRALEYLQRAEDLTDVPLMY